MGDAIVNGVTFAELYLENDGIEILRILRIYRVVRERTRTDGRGMNAGSNPEYGIVAVDATAEAIMKNDIPARTPTGTVIWYSIMIFAVVIAFQPLDRYIPIRVKGQDPLIYSSYFPHFLPFLFLTALAACTALVVDAVQQLPAGLEPLSQPSRRWK